MAEIVLRDALEGLDVIVDSAGMATGHAGFPMHPEAHAALANLGYDGSAHRARQFEDSWERDLILAMDNRNIADLKQMGAGNFRLFDEAREIPDPYFGDASDFAYALDLIIAGTPAIVSLISAILAE